MVAVRHQWTNTCLLLLTHLGLNFNKFVSKYGSFQNICFENVICKMASILSWPQWVKCELERYWDLPSELQVYDKASVLWTEASQSQDFLTGRHLIISNFWNVYARFAMRGRWRDRSALLFFFFLGGGGGGRGGGWGGGVGGVRGWGGGGVLSYFSLA